MEKNNRKQSKHSNQRKELIISREAWLAESRALAERIRKNHDYQMIDVDRFIELDKQEREDRFSDWLGD